MLKLGIFNKGCNMIDKDELLVELFEQGLDLSIYKNKDRYTAELKTTDGEILGVSSCKKPEKSLAIVIRRIAQDSVNYKKSNVVISDDKLSVL